MLGSGDSRSTETPVLLLQGSLACGETRGEGAGAGVGGIYREWWSVPLGLRFGGLEEALVRG